MQKVGRWLRALRTFKEYDAPPEVVAYAESSYIKCCEWFGRPTNADWPYRLYRGTSNACRLLPNLPCYMISFHELVLKAGSLAPVLEVLGHEMYHRVTWNTQGLRNRCWVDEMLASQVSIRLLISAGYGEFARAYEDSCRTGVKAPYRELCTFKPRSGSPAMMGETLPGPFYNSVRCLGFALVSAIGFRDTVALCACADWDTWISTIKPESRTIAKILLSPVEPEVECLKACPEPLNLTALKLATLGDSQFMLGQYDAAIASCEKAIEIHEGLLKAHWTLSFVYQDLGMTADFVRSMLNLARLCPHDAHVAWSLGHALAATGDLEGAKRQYSLACELEPGREEYARSLSKTIARITGAVPGPPEP